MMIPLEREGRRLPHEAILQALPSPCAYAWGVSISSLQLLSLLFTQPQALHLLTSSTPDLP